MTAPDPARIAFAAWAISTGDQGPTVEDAFYAGWESRGPSVREAGRRGAQAMLAHTTSDEMAARGRKGGAAVKAKQGAGYHSRIGTLGGRAAMANRSPAERSALARLGVAARERNRTAKEYPV